MCADTNTKKSAVTHEYTERYGNISYIWHMYVHMFICTEYIYDLV